MDAQETAFKFQQSMGHFQNWLGEAASESGIHAARSTIFDGYYLVTVEPRWFADNWEDTRDKINGITVFLSCTVAWNGDTPESPLAAAGGRIMLGYDDVSNVSEHEHDMDKFFGRLNGSLPMMRRTAGQAYDNGEGYSSGTKFAMFGNDWTTLGASPRFVGKTPIVNGKGAACIVFDTFMMSDISADAAVEITSGSGSQRCWFGSTGHKFGISFDFTDSVPSAKAEATKCKNEVCEGGVGRYLSGDRQTYGQDKSW